MSDPIRDVEPHDEAEMLLPWYATGKLDAADRLIVERHLSSCAECRDQLAIERRLARELRGFAPEVDAGWERLRRRMSQGQTGRATFRRPRRTSSLLRNPVIAGLAAAQLGVLVVGASLLLSMSRPNYRTLGSTAAPAAADAIVIFRPETKEGDVRAILKSMDATIVGGPTDANAYVLHVPPEKRRHSIESLQASRAVELAQPIDGALR